MNARPEFTPALGLRVLTPFGIRLLLTEAGVALGDPEDRPALLETSGKTATVVAIGNRTVGMVTVADTIMADSRAANAAMHALGIHVVMIAGDNERTAHQVASLVGIDEVQAGVLPEGTAGAIRELQSRYGARVAKVGDAINDAPALKQAKVGITIGAGADVAIEAADVTLVKGELSKAVKAKCPSRVTFSKIVQSLSWAWVYRVAAIPIAALGLLHSVIGVIAMTACSLSVIGNALLLKRTRLEVSKS